MSSGRAAVALAFLLAACDAGRGSPARPEARPDARPAMTAAAPPVPRAARPYALHVPSGLDRGAPAPLVVFFHGYGGDGAGSVAGFGLEAASDAGRFVLAYPDGTLDAQGRRFWNATHACCDFGGNRVDDAAYVRWLLDDVANRVAVDPRRVYLMGHSNGGFLALRLACELAPRVAAVVSIAGAGDTAPVACGAGGPVSVLQLHGDADRVVRYDGGLIFDRPGRDYPGAVATVRAFAARDGCTGGLVASGAPLDFDALVPGKEATPRSFAGCPAGVDVSLWTLAGGEHVPRPTVAGLGAVWAWMAAHPKP